MLNRLGGMLPDYSCESFASLAGTGGLRHPVPQAERLKSTGPHALERPAARV